MPIFGYGGYTETRTGVGFDVLSTKLNTPEFGGRIQLPAATGELAFTYHYRQVATGNIDFFNAPESPEHRFGIDGKWDLKIGLWVEATWVHATRDLGVLTNQHLVNLGVDYTFGLGNGLNLGMEQFLLSFDRQAFAYANSVVLTAFSTSYPLGLFDNLQALFYLDWTNDSLYSTIRWQRSFSRWTLNVLAFWNPENAQLPQQQGLQNLFGGKGIQLLAIYNY